MAKKAVEQTGLIPRSIIRTFDRFKKQLFSETENLIIQEFRISRYQFLVSIKCLFNLIFIPLISNFLLKNFLLIPLTETFWNNKQSEIFLNSYQQQQAFHELKKFQEKLYFDYLLNNQINFPFEIHQNFPAKKTTFFSQILQRNPSGKVFPKQSYDIYDQLFLTTSQRNLYLCASHKNFYSTSLNSQNKILPAIQVNQKNNNVYLDSNKHISEDAIKNLIKNKIVELAIYYNHQSIVAVTNLIGDFITFLIFSLVIMYMKPQISILKSFLTESIYSLNDTKKSFLLILGTDLLVGFHSPRGWEICLELLLRHFGFPQDKDFVFLFVASFPVLLDTVFKYWIFRYLNKISPSTVATYHNMIE